MRKIERQTAIAFIFSNDGRVLFGHTVAGGAYEGYWVVPGGGIEADETPREAVIREVKEEVGLDITTAEIQEKSVSKGLTEKTLRDTGERVLMDMTFHNFEIKIAAPATEIHPIAGDDFANPTWFDVAQLPNLALPGPSLETLREFGYM